MITLWYAFSISLLKTFIDVILRNKKRIFKYFRILGCNQLCLGDNRYQCLSSCQMGCQRKCMFQLQQPSFNFQMLPPPSKDHPCQPSCHQSTFHFDITSFPCPLQLHPVQKLMIYDHFLINKLQKWINLNIITNYCHNLQVVRTHAHWIM